MAIEKIPEMISGMFQMITDIMFNAARIMLTIWIDYVPRPAKWVLLVVVLSLSIYFIRWSYKNRYIWTELYCD